MYFMVYGDEDGMRIEAYTKEELLHEIAADELGEDTFVDFNHFRNMEWERGDWEKKYMVIKGEVVCPEAVKQVTEWEIE